MGPGRSSRAGPCTAGSGGVRRPGTAARTPACPDVRVRRFVMPGSGQNSLWRLRTGTRARSPRTGVSRRRLRSSASSCGSRSSSAGSGWVGCAAPGPGAVRASGFRDAAPPVLRETRAPVLTRPAGSAAGRRGGASGVRPGVEFAPNSHGSPSSRAAPTAGDTALDGWATARWIKSTATTWVTCGWSGREPSGRVCSRARRSSKTASCTCPTRGTSSRRSTAPAAISCGNTGGRSPRTGRVPHHRPRRDQSQSRHLRQPHHRHQRRRLCLRPRRRDAPLGLGDRDSRLQDASRQSDLRPHHRRRQDHLWAELHLGGWSRRVRHHRPRCQER